MSSIISVRLAKTQSEMEVVYQLTHDTFVEKRLCDEQEDQSLKNNQELDQHPGTQVFIALIDGEIRGTISLSLHDKMEEVYNYSFVSQLLARSYDSGRPAYSGWRLATKGSRIERYLLAVRLIMHGYKAIISGGSHQAYFSFLPSQLKVYKKFFPEGQILGQIRKQTRFIDGQLVLMKHRVSQSGYKHLESLYSSLAKKYRFKAR
ncbi:MAG: hypothetical protein R8P61_13885 [Bacteroidia bacterium]|nr:hypothetical protein [Bacteroidia bacterium]